ncbi:MAG: hypothetical protein PUG60_02545 [Lachnospiraceae bacterium]|nr:hypothetical protein [Lachnospiraceae bacterium]MDY4969844.1 DUF6773 family protein [Lachnospiraceae bacterium]
MSKVMKMMRSKKNNLDEMQELQLLRIEHNGCWMTFWGLLAVIIIQCITTPGNFRVLAGEWIVFMCQALYLSVSCIRHGIWDRHLRPDLRTNMMASSLAGLACGIIFGLISYIRYGKLLGSLATGAFMFIFVFFCTIIALSVSAILYKKKRRQMESEEEEND